jgi:hypothetical protein
MRREMFEATVWAESKDRNSTVARKVVISAEESDLLRQFHGCVARYFRQDGHEYKHDTPRYLERVHHLIDSAEIVSDTKKTKEQIQSTAADIGAYEHKLEGVFGEIARRYAALKSQLPAQ